DLAELLRAVGTEAASSEWLCQGVRSTAKETASGNPLESFADAGRRVSGADLIAAANNTAQTIDGEFLAYRSGRSEPWLCLKAIDSSFWEAFSADTSILDQLRASFSVITELPGSVSSVSNRETG